MAELNPWHHTCVSHHHQLMTKSQAENRKTREDWRNKFHRLINLSTKQHFPVELAGLVMSYAYEKWYEVAFPHLWQMAKSYQKTGVDFLVKRRGCGILADDMGLGKTLQAIMTTMVYAHARPCLVVCPKSLFGNWEENLARFVFNKKKAGSSSVLSIHSSKEFETCFAELGQTKMPQFLVLSFGLLTRLVHNAKHPTMVQKVLDQIKFLVIDESHACKNITSQRTSALLHVAEKVSHRLCLSGTPACKPKEMYSQWVIACPTLPPRESLTAKKEVQENLLRHAMAKKMDQDEFTKLLYEHVNFSFTLRWCKPTLRVIRTGRKMIPQLVVDGATRLHELFCILRMSCMLHRPKTILEKELPDLMRYKIVFPPPPVARRCFEKSTQEIQKLANDKDRCRPIYMREFNENIFAAKKDFAHFYILWILNTQRYNKQKIICYAHHKVFMEFLAQTLTDYQIKHVVIQGDTPSESRTAAERDFRESDEIRVALISVMAGGTGLNLQSASVVIFCELIWSPDVMLQAEARINRLGQTKKVECHYLVADPSLDDLILRIYRSKNINSGMILTGNARHVPFHVSINLKQEFSALSKDNQEEVCEFLNHSFSADHATQEEEEDEDDEDEEEKTEMAQMLLRSRF